MAVMRHTCPRADDDRYRIGQDGRSDPRLDGMARRHARSCMEDAAQGDGEQIFQDDRSRGGCIDPRGPSVGHATHAAVRTRSLRVQAAQQCPALRAQPRFCRDASQTAVGQRVPGRGAGRAGPRPPTRTGSKLATRRSSTSAAVRTGPRPRRPGGSKVAPARSRPRPARAARVGSLPMPSSLSPRPRLELHTAFNRLVRRRAGTRFRPRASRTHVGRQLTTVIGAFSLRCCSSCQGWATVHTCRSCFPPVSACAAQACPARPGEPRPSRRPRPCSSCSPERCCRRIADAGGETWRAGRDCGGPRLSDDGTADRQPARRHDDAGGRGASDRCVK